MDVIIIILVSISSIFSYHVNTVYAVPDNGSGNAAAQALAKDNNNTSNTPSVIRSSPEVVLILTTMHSLQQRQNRLTAATPTQMLPYRTPVQTAGRITPMMAPSSGNHHKDNSNKSHDLAHNIINKIKQKSK